ncbi:hypothetical protein GF367_03950 [Candidatus Woesearchaeota archaeon]|nr:hypothetical protein [Candidatus Woesearchaeota archaeon]
MIRACLFILLFLLPTAVAEETTIHDDWHEYHDFFTIGDDYYEATTVHLVGDDEMLVKTLLKRNQASYIMTATASEHDDEYFLDQESCKAEGIYRFCLKNISYDPEKGARSDEGGAYHYGTRIKIYEEVPETALLELSRTVNDDTLSYDEETKARLLIMNKGTETATNIVLNETVGDGLTITRFDDFDRRVGDTLQASMALLYPDEQRVYDYWFKADDYQNTSTLDAKASYDDPDPAATTKSTTITIPWPYATTFSLSPATLKPNREATLRYTVQNKESVDAQAALTATLDNGIQVNDAQGWERSRDKLLFTGTVPPGTKETFTATLTSPYTGTYAATIDLSLAVNDYHFSDRQKGSFTIKTDTITPTIVLSKSKMRSGEPITIGIYLHNEDNVLPFFNIDGWAGAAFFNETIAMDRLSPSAHENPVFKVYRPPAVQNQTTHTVEVSGTFTTQDGERNLFYTQESFTILPENQSIILGQTTSTDELARGEEVTVMIDAENIADSGSSYVEAVEDYDDDLEQTFGDTSGSTYLYGGESRQLYVYKLRVPYDYTKSNFTITSTLTAKGQPVTALTATITVTDPVEELAPLPPPQEDATPPANDSSDTPPDADEDNNLPEKEVITDPDEAEERQGILSRVINGIADFFADFFS